MYPMTPPKNVIDSLRVIAQSQEELSPQDIHEFFRVYDGPPEGLELLMNHFPFAFESYEASYLWPRFSILSTALRVYGLGGSDWGAFIRKLIRQGADLHSGIPQHASFSPVSPLDFLFFPRDYDSPLETKTVGDGWLQLLASEGCDINQYLEEEMRIHADKKKTFALCRFLFSNPYRRLFFEQGSKPSVSWDWWIDPSSPIALLSKEFPSIVIEGTREFDDWDLTWPIIQERLGHSLDQIDQRDERRVKKRAAKLARTQGFKRSFKLPGAWPA